MNNNKYIQSMLCVYVVNNLCVHSSRKVCDMIYNIQFLYVICILLDLSFHTITVSLISVSFADLRKILGIYKRNKGKCIHYDEKKH